MKKTSLYSQGQRFLATMLLFSVLLQSCGYNNLELYHNPPAPEHPGQGTGKATKDRSTRKDLAKPSKLYGEEHLPVELPPQPAGPEVASSPTPSQGSHGLAQNLSQGDPAPRSTPETAPAPSKPAHVVIAGAPAAREAAAPPVEEPKQASQLLARVFTASGGQQVQFHQTGGAWQASVSERPGGPFKVVPVHCQGHGDIQAALLALQGKPDKYVQRRIHVLPAAPPYLAMVYLGMQGLKGGGGEPSGSDDHRGEPLTRRQHTGAPGSGQDQGLADLQELLSSARNFFDAIRDNDAAKVTHLLNQDSRLLEKVLERDNGQGAIRERTPLMYAAQLGHQPMISLLIEHGAAVSQANSDGTTPLFIAAQKGHLETAQYLVGHRAAVNQANNNGPAVTLVQKVAP